VKPLSWGAPIENQRNPARPKHLPYGFLHKSFVREDAFIDKPAFTNIIGGAAGLAESK
jgi:hypothetical protein